MQENLGEFPSSGQRDQGDRAEAPMTRRKARTVPVMGEKEIQDSPSDPAPKAKAAKPAAGPKRKKS